MSNRFSEGTALLVTSIDSLRALVKVVLVGIGLANGNAVYGQYFSYVSYSQCISLHSAY